VDRKRQAVPGPDGAAIPGFDVAGVVDSLGAGVTNVKVGEPVFARANGGYAQYAVTDADGVVPKPKSFTFEQAAGIPVAGMAGYRAVEAAQVKAGQRVAIIGAAGGAGSAAVEIAKARGAKVVAIGHSSQEAFLKSLKADEFVAYDRSNVAERVRDVDAVLNMVDGQADPGVKYAKRGGHLASIAGPASQEACAAAGLTCIQIGPTYRGPTSEPDTLRALAKLADEGKYTVRVTKSVPLAEAASAQQANLTGETVGKLVLAVDERAKQR
ncbi:MAG: NADP-dependent oxidoreductase, partial [Proteobacteria bacterium]